MREIVILGAGTAGTIMLNKLRKALSLHEWNITIIDRNDLHYYQPGFLFIPFGIYSQEDVVRKKSEFFPEHIVSITEGIKKIDVEKCLVILDSDRELPYDILIVATGCDIAPVETKGLLGPLWHEKIFDFYTFEGSIALAKALDGFEQGRLVVHITEMPIKCPVAPLEFIFLADSYFKKKGIRDKVQLTFVTPLSGAFTRPKATAALSYLLEKKAIEVISDFSVEFIDNDCCEVVSYDGMKVPFDLLVSIPTNIGSSAIGESGLGDELNFISTDKHTLQSLEHKNIFVIGDATDLPTSKAGSVAHFESEILLENILSFIAEKPLLAKFDGHANCFVESGDDMAMLIDFNYEVEPLEGRFPLPILGPMSLLKESRLNHYGKLMFKWVYWNLLLRGIKIPIGPNMSMKGKKGIKPREGADYE